MDRRLTRRRPTALTLALATLATLAVFVASLLAPVAAVYAVSAPPPIQVSATLPSGKPTQPMLTSKAALIIDADTGQVLFAKNADERLPMASTTKIMTAILVLESLDLNTEVLVSRKAHFQSGSVVGLNTLDKFTVEKLSYWMLVFSGNDAAVALAEKTAGSVDTFVARMNDKAKAMGLANTHFTNANGLGETGHYSSCSDLAAMARYAMKNETFRAIVRTTVYELPHPGAYTPEEPKNSNALLTKYDWVTGIKTGSTPAAGYCMVASGTREGISLIAVQLGAKDDATRWVDVEALFEYGFDLSPAVALAQPGQALANISVGDPLGQSVALVPKAQLVTRLREGEAATGTITLSHALTLPIQAGDVLGSVEFTVKDKSLGKTDLVAGQALYPPSARRMLVHARNWYLPEFQISDRGDQYPH
jgi:D-alanyl-D-alanine carboxypeptidase (penicillin-binding protein 5/6)